MKLLQANPAIAFPVEIITAISNGYIPAASTEPRGAAKVIRVSIRREIASPTTRRRRGSRPAVEARDHVRQRRRNLTRISIIQVDYQFGKNLAKAETQEWPFQLSFSSSFEGRLPRFTGNFGWWLSAGAGVGRTLGLR